MGQVGHVAARVIVCRCGLLLFGLWLSGLSLYGLLLCRLLLCRLLLCRLLLCRLLRCGLKAALAPAGSPELCKPFRPDYASRSARIMPIAPPKGGDHLSFIDRHSSREQMRTRRG